MESKLYHFLNADEAYTEAQKRIKECLEARAAKPDFSLRQKPVTPGMKDSPFRSKNSSPNFTEFMYNLKEIPPEIVELDFLTELDLSGTGLTEIPEFLVNLSFLKKLSLGAKILELPQWLGDFGNLEVLEIENENIETVPRTISNQKRLRKLRIHGERIASLPEEIGEKLSLTSLDLKCPQLSSLPESFANLATLRNFRFDDCKLASVPEFICGWPELTKLEINTEGYYFRPYTSVQALPENIGNLKKLKHLSIKAACIATIPDSLGNCPLEYLELTGHYKTIPEAFANLSKLKILKLSSPELKTLPESLGNLSSLKELRIESDKLSALPQSLSELKGLEEIYLDTFSLEALPGAFGNLCKLKIIDIFSGKMTELPDSIGNLRNLKSIHLDVYNLASFPDSFNELSYIKKADILTAPRSSELPWSKKKRGITGLEELAEIKNGRYREKLIETYSIKQLESFLCPEDLFFHILPNYDEMILYHDKKLRSDIIETRRSKLNRKFKWTDENKKLITQVSDEFTKAWGNGFSKAKTIIETLYEKETDKDSFEDKYEFEIVLNPMERNEDGSFSVNIINSLDGFIEDLLSMKVQYDPVTKCEDSFWNDLYINGESNWNTENLSGIALHEHRICRAVNTLSGVWALADIARINYISAEVRLTYRLEGSITEIRVFEQKAQGGAVE